MCVIAAENGQLEVFKFAKANRWPSDANTSTFDAAKAKLNVLQ